MYGRVAVPSTYLTLLKSLCIIDVGFGLVGTLILVI
jgi:hypothetical protein